MAIAHDLWKQFGGLTAGDIPVDTEMVATQCILDWFACALAGSGEPLARILRDEYGDVPGPSSVVGTNLRVRPSHAALINGATGHALDFDDTHTGMGGHPTAPVLPAVLAVGEEIGANGAAVLAAFVVGSEVEDMLGAALGARPYARGWHITSLVGVLGATAGVSRLLGLDADQFAHALGIAASQSSGLKANFGTMTKPLHAGQAAERGVMSARLAARGFTASAEAIDGRQGLAVASGAEELRRERLDAADGEWLMTQTLFKYHAACYLTHAAIESAGSLRARMSGDVADLADVTDVVVTVHPSLLSVCAIPEPRTGLEAKFSLRATTALALLGDDTTDPATFNDARVCAPDVQDLLHRVRIVTDDGLAGTQSTLRVAFSGGSAGSVGSAESVVGGGSLEARFDSGIPATDLAAQGRKLRAKFDALAGPVLGERAGALADRIANIRALTNVTELFG